MAAAHKMITLEQASTELDDALGTVEPLVDAVTQLSVARQAAPDRRIVRGRLPRFPQTPDEISDRLNMAAIRHAIHGADLEAARQREARERTIAARAALSRPRPFERASQGLHAAAMAFLPHVGLSMILQSGIGRAASITSRSV